MITVEICAFTLQGCMAALQGGAQRIELCSGPADGGTTPNYGLLKAVKKFITIPVLPIIRPRGGDFLYNTHEFEQIKDDVKLCLDLGFEGVVIGFLKPNGEIDVDKTAEIVSLTNGKEVVFHRAFDRCVNMPAALEQIINSGCKRILTSGGFPNVMDGLTKLQNLVVLANGRIEIMPGSGVTVANAKQIIKQTGAKNIHASLRVQQTTEMMYKNANFAITDGDFTSIEPAEVAALVNSLA
jgi:copper homeostasis protein